MTGISGITLGGTSGSSYFSAVAVTLSVNHDSLAAELCITNGTVNCVVVGSFVYTIGINVVFNDNRAFGVANHRDLYISLGLTAS